MPPAKKILFPTDLSANSRKLAPYVISMSKKYDSVVHVLHVIPNHLIALPYAPMDRNVQTLFKSAEENLKTFSREHLAGCRTIQAKIMAGVPAAEILRYALEEQIDLIVIGSHGHTGLEHTLFGSVAMNVIKKSSIPVLVINVNNPENKTNYFWSWSEPEHSI